MAKTQYIFLLLFTGFLWNSSAQTGNIQGNVRTADDAPAQFVNIGLKGTSYGAISDRDGKFLLKNLKAGEYTLVASYVGLVTQEKTVSVRAGETTLVDFVLRESAEELKEVVITSDANRYNIGATSPSLRMRTPILEVPQNIQVITGRTLKDQQVISMSDGVLRNVSGAVRLEHWGDLYTNVSARGSQIQAFRNGYNVVNSYWGPLTEDMSFVDKIEFVKGPAGFLLANGDPSGSYNVVTKKPTGETKGEVSLTMGSFDLYRSTLDLDGKLSSDGRLLYRLNVSAQNKKSHRANEYNNRYAIAPVVSYQLDEKTKLTLEYTYQRADMSDVGSFYIFSTDGYATLPRDFTMLPAGLPGTTIRDHSMFADLEHNLTDRWKVTGRIARFDYRQEGSSMWPAAVNPNGTVQRAVSSWDAKSLMTMGQALVTGEATTGSVQHQILAGIDVSNKAYFADWGQYHQLDTVGGELNTASPALNPTNGYPSFDFTTPIEQRAQLAGGLINQRYSALYVQDELSFINNLLRLTLAGRYTTISQSQYGGPEVSDNHFTPRVGLSGSVNKQTSVYALYDQAFIPQSGQLSNGAQVQPITGNNLELGVKRDWMDGRWNSTLSVYRILKNNELTADPNSPPTSGLSVELGQKTAQGIEFDLRGSILPGLNLIANYAFTDSRVTKVTDGVSVVTEGDIIPGFARHTANTWLSYKVQQGVLSGVGISAGFTFLAGRETYWEAAPNGSELPAYFKLDGGLFWEKEQFRVTANVFNITDEYLYSGSYYSWLNAYYWQTEPGRNARITLAYQF